MNNPATELYQALSQLSHEYPGLMCLGLMLDKALAAAELIDDLRRERDELFGALTNASTELTVADFTTGTCCCGDDMAAHGYTSNHAPVDEGEDYKRRTLEGCQKALEAVPEVSLAGVRSQAICEAISSIAITYNHATVSQMMPVIAFEFALDEYDKALLKYADHLKKEAT